ERAGAAEHWEAEAARWAAWAREPGHDAYWYYRDAFFALLPPPGRRTLEVGCGEGRVARDLAACGHRVVAVDVSRTLIALAGGAPRRPPVCPRGSGTPASGMAGGRSRRGLQLLDGRRRHAGSGARDRARSRPGGPPLRLPHASLHGCRPVHLAGARRALRGGG